MSVSAFTSTLAQELAADMLGRFLRYVQVDTQSKRDRTSSPSTPGQLELARMPELASKLGHDIVTSSGSTLLGADDKAGVAEIMAAIAHLAAHPELPRPTLRVAFTPDEEIGEGATLFDIERFGALCAYTMDGSELGELQDETFSAYEVSITIR